MFVKFSARGVIYERDKDNRICGVKSHRSGSGVIKDTPTLMGGGLSSVSPASPLRQRNGENLPALNTVRVHHSPH